MDTTLEKKSYFFETETINLPGAQGEFEVWKAIKKAFQDRECIAYWRYPVFSKIGKKRKEVDILIVDRILGAIIIEVKSISIHQIQSINGHSWYLKDFYEEFANPYQQAESGLFTLLSKFDQYPALFRKIRGKAIVALPYINRQEWETKGFATSICSPNVMLRENLKNILNFIENNTSLVNGNALDAEQWHIILSTLNGGDFHSSGSTTFPSSTTQVALSNDPKKSTVLAYMNQFFHQVDLDQSIIGLEIPSGVQRIRGIAGSGKTILLCQKAAVMHLKYPHWKIALIFFTRTLYEQVIVTLDRWLRYYSDGEYGYHKNNHHLIVCHAWGSKNTLGFYKYICKQHNLKSLNVDDIEAYQKPNERLAYAITQLLSQTKINPIFDAVLIDEGQDLVVDPPELKFLNKQPIYWLAYESLKSIDPNSPKDKRLIWAYDEAQSLDSQKIPTGKEILGEDFSDILIGHHRSHIMKKCYRVPEPILLAAHALGMGFLRKGGLLSGITTKEEWEKIGYEVMGDFRLKDQKVTLTRPKENSPNPIIHHWKSSPIIEFKTYLTRQEEIDDLAKNIRYDVEYHGLKPSRNILVIVLSQQSSISLESEYAKGLMQHHIPVYIATATHINQLHPKYPDHSPDQFWMEGGITLSRISRAKGNEAEMVYVVGLDQIAMDESNLVLRNQLFVALSRAKAWIRISGIGSYELYDEVRNVLNAGNSFEFIPKPTKDISHESEQLSLF